MAPLQAVIPLALQILYFLPTLTFGGKAGALQSGETYDSQAPSFFTMELCIFTLSLNIEGTTERYLNLKSLFTKFTMKILL